MQEPIITDKNIMLIVPFGDKEKVASLGAKPRWDNQDGQRKFVGWYVPGGLDLRLFSEWWTDKLKARFGVESQKPQAITLTELRKMVKRAVEAGVSGTHWIVADIVNITGSNHTYLELADYDQHGRIASKVQGIIFSSDRRIMTNFERDTGMRIARNMKVMIKVEYSYSLQYGESLKVLEFNSSHTIGEMEAKLNKIRASLQAEGVWNLNRSKPLPTDFTSVAVIAPEGAAGLHDFKTKSDALAEHGVCEFHYFPAVFQGAAAKKTITDAITEVARQHSLKIREFDAVTIIRGGGDKSGLYALNEYEIAKALCNLPIPCYVGIGHEVDNTLLDEIAAKRCPTPSMVISTISDVIIGNAQRAERDLLRVTRSADNVLSRAEMGVEKHYNRVSRCAEAVIQDAVNHSERIFNGIVAAGERSLNMAEKESVRSFDSILLHANQGLDQAAGNINLIMTTILFHNPSRIIDRGYCVLRSPDGETIGNSSQLSKGDKVKITMRDGTVSTVIEEITIKEKES